jgi:DNA-binding NarL/FixJ family response regulator
VGEAIRVLVVDDHSLVRQGIVSALSTESDIKVVGQAANGREAVDQAIKLNPDVITMDVMMPVCTGLDALVLVREKVPKAKVIMISVSENEEDLLKAIKYGAQGYLLKSANITEIAEAIRKTAAGEAVLSSAIAGKLLGEFRERTHEIKLGEREMEVLVAVGEGYTNTEIAQRLFIGESTVRTHLRRVLEKLHLRNRAEAVAYATRHYATLSRSNHEQ